MILFKQVFNFSNFMFSFLMTVTTPRVAAAAARDNRAEARVATAFWRCLTCDKLLACHCCTVSRFVFEILFDAFCARCSARYISNPADKAF